VNEATTEVIRVDSRSSRKTAHTIVREELRYGKPAHRSVWDDRLAAVRPRAPGGRTVLPPLCPGDCEGGETAVPALRWYRVSPEGDCSVTEGKEAEAQARLDEIAPQYLEAISTTGDPWDEFTDHGPADLRDVLAALRRVRMYAAGIKGVDPDVSVGIIRALEGWEEPAA
jgi:hypothetical protein